MKHDHSLIGEHAIKPMEILLVEDGWTDARVTIYAVRRSQVHHRLTLVRSVSEAISFLRQEGIFARAPRPDLLLLDMMLPDGTGLDVLQFLSEAQEADFDLPRITTVVLTASNDANLRVQCQDLCVSDFMNKPVREADFMRVIRDHKRLMVHTTPVLAGA
ncbi:response regulator [Rubripirellula amarantea]|uniref:Response regulator rcp1 n=1 Tax=Rubripirellula amarantea TaxID=2527999 RepID=A0A5C5WJT2_9BACT|nr:response regulator [Rubripirellula amarantea]MDA8743952.1 response regulator [Rubripirellula amarantea]TWT50271.1 Response regulator rcp1 [Rubripirellula amarantea]